MGIGTDTCISTNIGTGSSIYTSMGTGAISGHGMYSSDPRALHVHATIRTCIIVRHLILLCTPRTCDDTDVHDDSDGDMPHSHNFTM